MVYTYTEYKINDTLLRSFYTTGVCETWRKIVFLAFPREIRSRFCTYIYIFKYLYNKCNFVADFTEIMCGREFSFFTFF